MGEEQEMALEIANVLMRKLDSALPPWIRTVHDQQASPRRKPTCQTAGGELSTDLIARAPERMDSVISRYAAGKQCMESRTS